jgi:hypothetical protein
MRTTCYLILFIFLLCASKALAQQESLTPEYRSPDSTLRIINLSPYFNVHVDSTLLYKLEINKIESDYYWFLKNSPVGLRINKDNGLLTFRAEKSYFLSGKLKYDLEYKVTVGVQNLHNPKDRADTSFTIVFYSTEIIPSRIKPSVSSVLVVDEGDTINFKIQCENGSFPIEYISFFANSPLYHFTPIKKCDDNFTWSPSYDFVKDNDSGRVKILVLNFVGSNKFESKDTAIVKIVVRDALNYPLALMDYNLAAKNVSGYVLQLKYTFLQLDKRVKGNKTARTSFDITSSTTALTGSILSSSGGESAQKTGKILPSVGVSLVPIKEAVAPQKVFDQNQASLIRASIKRLEYMLRDNGLVAEKDPYISLKTNKLKEELKQIQVQLIDVPMDLASTLSEDDLNEYFNSPKVNKKYRLKK